MRDAPAADPVHRAGDRLKQAGIGNGRQEARWLWQAVTHTPLALVGEATPDEIAAFDAALARRLSGEPLQHVIGETPFLHLTLKTDPRALIPRPDSETVVQLALDLLATMTNPKRVADLGTGAGALLCAILDLYPALEGVAVEQSADALALARENFTALGLSGRVEAFHGSWGAWTGWASCDLILSNPPYIESAVIPTLDPEVREHDPLDALDGGPDGLEAYREIIGLAAQQMKSGAWLVLETGYDQRDSVTAILDKRGFTNLMHRKDLSNNDRAIAAQQP